MLIQALCEYADKQLENDAPDGWQEQQIHFRILLRPDGEIADIVDVRKTEPKTNSKGKTTEKKVPVTIFLPERTQKSSICSNIIEHRPLYIFGLNYEKDAFTPDDSTDKARKSHKAFVEKNLEFFENIHSEICDAYRLFLEKWDPETMYSHPALVKVGKEYKGAYFGFSLEGFRSPLEEDDAFKAAYSEHLAERPVSDSSEKTVMCGILGEMLPPARIHDKVKFPGGNSTGCVMVGMKETSFESYNKTQSFNSNISETAMKKYTSAMNSLLADRSHYKTIDELVIMYFAMKSDDSVECGAFASFFGGISTDAKEIAEDANADIDNMMKLVPAGAVNQLPDQEFDSDVMFYIVGMTPNSSRISQKFIYKDRFGNIIRHLQQHQEDLKIIGNSRSIYFSGIKKELISPKSSKDTVPSPLSTALILAALHGTPYPDALLSTIVRRVKTDSDGENEHMTKINPTRAGIIKACLNRKARANNRKEEITMAWNDNNHDPAYLCGGLFAVYEMIQKKSAEPVKLNRTIKDSYFASACSCPNVIMPKLEKLSQNHIKKIPESSAVYYQKLVDSLMNGLDGGFPSTLSLDDQGRFIVGYHQMNARLYTKKTEQED